MGTTARVSIITVTLDSQATIGRTIESVLGQVTPVDEYLIIDGGSTDGTLDIVRRYAAENRLAGLRYLSEKDRGIADAFNKGIALAKGEIIGILNSDDCYEAETVSRVLEVFREHPQAGFVFGDLDYLDAGGRVVHHVRGTEDVAAKIRQRIVAVNHPTLFVRREVYSQYGGYDARFQLSMDHEFVLRLVVRGVAGVYDAEIRACMSLGGASDRHWCKALSECRRAFIMHGTHPLRAWAYYLFVVAKGILRRLCDWLLPRALAARLRAWANPSWRRAGGC